MVSKVQGKFSYQVEIELTLKKAYFMIRALRSCE